MMDGAGSPRTLAIDIGGTRVKASVLDADGRMVAPEVRLPTPTLPSPEVLLGVIDKLAQQLPDFDRISAGFPGYLAKGRVRTAPNLGTDQWRDYPLAEALAKHFGRPARVLNDADVQGLGVINCHGLELVLTLGTGIGSALFIDGQLLPHLELGQHPIRKGKTYDQYLGDAALRRKGPIKWNRRLRKTLPIIETLFNYDTLHLGGGNAAAINFPLPKNVQIADNRGGITGGVRLWDSRLEKFFTTESSAGA
jgi:polyphosphate glucokinase